MINMKKIISLLVIFALALSVFVSCIDGGEDITLPPEDESSSVSANASEYSFVCNGTKVTPHAKMSDLLAGLGDPVAYEESPSCKYQGLDKDYTYSGFKLRTYPVDGVDYILNICFIDDSVETPEGIMLGSTKDEVIAAYGTSFTESSGNMIYVKEKTEIRFRFNDNSVNAIEYWAVEE